MRPKVFIGLAAVLAGLIFLGWIVSVRMKGVEMPQADLPTLQDLSKKMNVVPDTFPAPTESALPILHDHMPEFAGIERWLNGGPIAQADLRGKVVLIDFWTYSCINCIRTLPYVTAWHDTYRDQGFTVIGVHTPEFAFEKEADNVEKAIARHGIHYPVPLDNAYGTWNNYSNRYWPAHYLFDARGRLRYYHFGEGKYDETERAIQSLIKENQGSVAAGTMPEVPAPDFQKIGSHETYLGYERLELLGSPEQIVRNGSQTYSARPKPELNRYYLVGKWRVEGERALPETAGAKIIYRYQAATSNLVMGSVDGKPVRVKVLIDGGLVQELLVGEERLYELFDDGGAYSEHLLELIFESPGTAVYAFTFG
jgi:thiol-disulfide isomerase/thioredoxin